MRVRPGSWVARHCNIASVCHVYGTVVHSGVAACIPAQDLCVGTQMCAGSWTSQLLNCPRAARDAIDSTAVCAALCRCARYVVGIVPSTVQMSDLGPSVNCNTAAALAEIWIREHSQRVTNGSIWDAYCSQTNYLHPARTMLPCPGLPYVVALCPGTFVFSHIDINPVACLCIDEIPIDRCS